MKIARYEQNLLAAVSNVTVEQETASRCAIYYYCNATYEFCSRLANFQMDGNITAASVIFTTEPGKYGIRPIAIREPSGTNLASQIRPNAKIMAEPIIMAKILFK